MSDDYMKYDGRKLEPPYQTDEDEIFRLREELKQAERQLAGVVETLKQLLSIQGETIPVMNDEYVRLSWVRDIAEQALANLKEQER